jgi:hypothetical protein
MGSGFASISPRIHGTGPGAGRGAALGAMGGGVEGATDEGAFCPIIALGLTDAARTAFTKSRRRMPLLLVRKFHRSAAWRLPRVAQSCGVVRSPGALPQIKIPKLYPVATTTSASRRYARRPQSRSRSPAPQDCEPRDLRERALVRCSGLCRRLELEHIAPHYLRHSCAKLCHVNGGELEQIQLLPGHASVLTTEHYLGCRQNLKEPLDDRVGPLFVDRRLERAKPCSHLAVRSARRGYQ